MRHLRQSERNNKTRVMAHCNRRLIASDDSSHRLMNVRVAVTLTVTVERRRRAYRIEQRKADKAGKEAADMRLPGDASLDAGQCESAEPEQQIGAEPHQQKHQQPRVAQHCAQWCRRYSVGGVLAAT